MMLGTLISVKKVFFCHVVQFQRTKEKLSMYSIRMQFISWDRDRNLSRRLKQNLGSSQDSCGAQSQVDILPTERSSHSVASIQTTK